jgi:hypothetical protein
VVSYAADPGQRETSVMDAYEERLRARLQPEQVVGNLLRVGVALTLYELVKPRVLDQVRDFFTFGFDENGPLFDEVAYEKKVRSLNPKSDFKASMEWLKSLDAITDDDIQTLGRLYEYRKAMAHESGSFIVNPEFEVQDDLIDSARGVFEKLGRFWARIDIETDEMVDEREIADDDIQPADILFFDHVHSIERAWQKELAELIRLERET